jgi:Holliday junction resolvase
MKNPKRKGYLAERKVRMIFQEHGWATVRSGGSLGPADLVCLGEGRCILIQVKSTKKKAIYTGETLSEIQGFPLYVVVDFGYGNIRVFKPGEKAIREEGIPLREFLKKRLNSRE